MVEAGGVNGGVPDSLFAQALEFAHAHAVQLIAPQLELAQKVARPKVCPDVDVKPGHLPCNVRCASPSLTEFASPVGWCTPQRVVETAVPSPALLQDVRETLTPLTQHIVSQRLAKTEREASFGEARRRAGAAVTEAWAARGDTVGAAALLVALDTVEGEWWRRDAERWRD